MALASILPACGGGSATPSVPNTAAVPAAAVPAANTTAATVAGAKTHVDSSTFVSGSAVAVPLYVAAGAKTFGVWVAATGFTGGYANAVSTAIETSKVTDPAPEGVYQNKRTGMSTFVQAGLTPNAAYNVRFHFAETFWHVAGKRVFSDTINGAAAQQNFDILKAAGGANIAVAEDFSTNADTAGKITVAFTASADKAMISGIAISSGTSTSPTPTPAPTAGPTATPVAKSGDVMPWVYSELWEKSSPIMTSVAALKQAGATTVAHEYMDKVWSQGIPSQAAAAYIPIYTATAGDPVRTATCTMFGGKCNADGVKVHVPSYAVDQVTSDEHMIVVDPTNNIEVDCWKADLSGSSLKCGSAGAYTLGSNALHDSGSEGIHFGPAASSFIITPQELVNGHIDHALGLDVECLNNATVYPADQSNGGTDHACSGGGSNPPHYGSLVHLLWTPAQIADSAYSAPCKTILTALVDYGAYLSDTGNEGLKLQTDSAQPYTANPATKSLDPWPGLQAKLSAAGDGSGSGDKGYWRSCLNRLTSNDFEMLEISQSR